MEAAVLRKKNKNKQASSGGVPALLRLPGGDLIGIRLWIAWLWLLFGLGGRRRFYYRCCVVRRKEGFFFVVDRLVGAGSGCRRMNDDEM